MQAWWNETVKKAEKKNPSLHEAYILIGMAKDNT